MAVWVVRILVGVLFVIGEMDWTDHIASAFESLKEKREGGQTGHKDRQTIKGRRGGRARSSWR